MIYYQDATVSLYHGANLDVLPHLEAGSVDCVVTSPPYFGLRDYGVAGQYGAEETPAEFVANLVATFREVRRVLADDGVAWLNLGDSYVGSAKPGSVSKTLVGTSQQVSSAGTFRSKPGQPKNLLGIPWRTAFALQDDGWILRNAVVWNKPNAMPESVTDRLSTRYEMLFLLSKSRKYWFDLDPIRATARSSQEKFDNAAKVVQANVARGEAKQSKFSGGVPFTNGPNPLGTNPGDVWDIATAPFPGAHFATYPPELVRRCIVSGCKPGGTVLDPFHGSGTTGMVATRNGRKYVGIELNQEYLDLSLRTRMAAKTFDFETEETA